LEKKRRPDIVVFISATDEGRKKKIKDLGGGGGTIAIYTSPFIEKKGERLSMSFEPGPPERKKRSCQAN